jgi:hypothetical protein
MDKTNLNAKTGKPKVASRGGARAGAGRPKGGTNSISISELLNSLEAKSNGRRYEDVLAEDFTAARLDNDRALVLKYHNLILNKVMNNLAKIEINEGADVVEAKKAAFAEAIAKLAGVETKE